MFPDRMISLMKQKKITKKQMSEECGFGINQIKYWQTNLNTPNADTMTKIANKLETSTAYLLELTDDPDPLTFVFPVEKDPPLLTRIGEALQTGELTEEDIKDLDKYVDYLVNRKNK